jgi:hypothetical protein
MTRILISTYTDPNGVERTQVYRNQSIHFSRKRQDRNTIETAKRVVRDLFENEPLGAEVIWWDGDHKLKHTVVTKS